MNDGLITILFASAVFILFGLKIGSYLITYFKLKKKGFKEIAIVEELNVFQDGEGNVPVIRLKNQPEKTIQVVKCYFGNFYRVGEKITIYLSREADENDLNIIECVVESPRQVFKLILSLGSFIFVYSIILIAYFSGWW